MGKSRNVEEGNRGTPEWRARVRHSVIQEIKKGYSEEDSANRSGIHPQTHWRWRQQDPEYNAKVYSARAELERKIKAKVLDYMRDDLTFLQSAKAAGRTSATLLAWRRRDSAFDAKVRRCITQQRRKRANEAWARKAKEIKVQAPKDGTPNSADQNTNAH